MKRLGDAEKTVTRHPVWNSISKTLAAIGPEKALETLIDEIPSTLKTSVEKDEEGRYFVDWGDRTRYYAVTAAISDMGEAANSTAPIFVNILRNGPEDRRWATMYTLSQFGDKALPAIPDYILNLDHREFNYKVIACRALAELGPAAKDAVPKLLKLTEKPELLSTRTHAAMCLAAIGPTEGVDLIELFTTMIEEPNAFSQERGLVALGRLGKHAENKKSFVEGLLANKDFSQRPEAARTLWQITGEAAPTLEILRGLIDDPTYDGRVYVVLKEMGTDAAPMADTIVAKLNSDAEELMLDQSLKQEMIQILVSMGKAKEHAESIRGALVGAAPDTAMLIDKVLADTEISDASE